MPMGGKYEGRKPKAGSMPKKKGMGKSSGKSLTSGLKRFQGVLKEGQTLKNIDGVTYVFDKNSALMKKRGGTFKGTF